MDRKRKLLHLITGLTTGGAEQALYNLLKGGLANHMDNNVVSLRNDGTMGERIRALGVPVVPLNLDTARFLPSGLAKLRKIVRQFEPDVIQGWMYHGNIAASLARRLADKRASLVWSIHSSLYDLNFESAITRQVIRLNRLWSKNTDSIVYVSQLSRQMHKDFGFFSDNGRVIPNGTDTQRYQFSSSVRLRVRSNLGIPDDAVVVGHIARLNPVKDHAGFLAAAAQVAVHFPHVHFLLCGYDVVWENETLVAHIQIRDKKRFHLLGERHDVPDLMSAMDVFCQSSKSEAFPIVLGEAMASQVPCVATAVGDSAMIIGDTGIAVPPNDVQALTEGIEKMLELGSLDRRTLGATARTRIQQKFSLGSTIAEHVSLYDEMTRQRDSSPFLRR